MKLDPVGTLICAITAVPAGASAGSTHSTEPSDTDSPASAVHALKSMVEPIEPVEVPSTVPSVTHESNSASALRAQNRGFVPPMSAPKGASTWKAGGSVICCSASAYSM